MSLPTVSLVGNLTADPELRYTQAGKPVTSFSVACNERRKDQATGDWVDGDTTFLQVTCWRNSEAINNTLGRGSKVMVVGTLKQRSWESKTGEKHTTHELNAQEVAQIITDKKGVDQVAHSYSAPADDPWPTTAPADPWAGQNSAEDTPF